MTDVHELQRLQERIDAARSSQIVGPSTARPVAVSINNGPLVYGELTIEAEQDTVHFALPFDTRVILRRSWVVEVELPRPFDEYHDPVSLRMGDTTTQPYVGMAHMVDQRADAWTPHITARFRGFGELASYISPGAPAPS